MLQARFLQKDKTDRIPDRSNFFRKDLDNLGLCMLLCTNKTNLKTKTRQLTSKNAKKYYAVMGK